MKIEQFFDENLFQASYLVVSEGEAVVIDPSRDIERYIKYAHDHYASIHAIIETHPHADFVSGHAELSGKTGATIYTSKLANVVYPHLPFDDGDIIKLGACQLHACNTPGHSPDSICIILKQEEKECAIFTGDTLFAGDVGRPDLLEFAGNIKISREELAKQLYHSTRGKLMKLPADVIVSPTHCAGSLCGKNIGPERFSTIGKEMENNYALREMSEKEFIRLILKDLPFQPRYFAYNVELNLKGAPYISEISNKIPVFHEPSLLDKNRLLVDIRTHEHFAQKHLKGSINIPLGLRFETWLGSVVNPNESFYLIMDTREQDENEYINGIIKRIAKIGYDLFLNGVLMTHSPGKIKSEKLNLKDFTKYQKKYNILDVRNESEAKHKIFKNSIHIPLPALRERLKEIPKNKPLVVHCTGGYRSAIAFSILEGRMRQKVYNLGEAVDDFK